MESGFRYFAIVSTAISALASQSIAQATRPAEAVTQPATVPATAAEIEELRQLGKRNIRAHDPSTIIKCKDQYWVFATGNGIPTLHSKDLKTWSSGAPVFQAPPGWVATEVPDNRNASFWAPDCIKVGEQYLLFYSVSTMGKNRSAIAVATNKTLDQSDPEYKWVDGGVVVRAIPSDNFNTIDPAAFLDKDGKLWMVFGSYWSGIKLIELDPKTGRRIAEDSPMHSLAYEKSVEASYIFLHNDKYYLFINHGSCCSGVRSTYHTLVGRSDKVTGPYLDKEGRDLMKSEGTPFLSAQGLMFGPGHAGIYEEDGKFWYSSHFYDGSDRGRPKLLIRSLTWDAAGWPVLEKVD